jgi:crotonobetainyl-CoA:carnitine CoA-transferase CaiB-like acyl-CoA transferase
VVVHNIRPRSADRLGIGYDAVRAVKPDIVYCTARGFGDGPQGDEPAYDDCIQAASGIAWLNADAAGQPRFVPTVMCDKVAGLHLALAIAAGIASRARTGEGVFIDTPMYETMVSFLMVEHLGRTTFDPPTGPMGYDRLSSPNRRPYATQDGYIAVMPYSTAHWQRYLRIIGRDDLADDPRVTDAGLRSANIDMLYATVAAASPARTTDDWVALLRAAEIPHARVNRVDDLPADPQLVAGGLFGTIDHPVEGRLRSVRSPFVVRDGETIADRAAPVLGADGAAILAELG